MAEVRQVISMAATDMNTVLISQRMAAGTVGPVILMVEPILKT